MDPFSLCASILAIVTTAQSGVQGLRKIKQCWKAPQEIDDLVLEIESLQSTLRDVAAFVDTANSTLYSESLSQPVTRASSMIDSIVALCSSTPFRATNLSDANRARLVWLRHKNEIKSLLENLKIVRIDLSVKLGLVAAYVYMNIHAIDLTPPLTFQLTADQVFCHTYRGIVEHFHRYSGPSFTTAVHCCGSGSTQQQYFTAFHSRKQQNLRQQQS